HPLQELACVGGQRLDVAPLALGVNRVEGERRLARAADPGEDHQPAVRQRQVDALQVVRAGPADDQLARGALSRFGVKLGHGCYCSVFATGAKRAMVLRPRQAVVSLPRLCPIKTARIPPSSDHPVTTYAPRRLTQLDASLT